MKKYAWLAQLEELLADLPEQEREDALAYYEEYLDAAGKENEQQTLAALGSPEEVAQKILEGEGLTGTAAPAGPDAAAVPAAADAPQNAAAAPAAGESAPTAPQPTAPEPPAAFAADEAAPASYTPQAKKGFHPLSDPPKPFSKRGWMLFLAVIAAALLIQLALLIAHFAGRSRETRYDVAVAGTPGPAEMDTDYGTASSDAAERAPVVVRDEAAVAGTADAPAVYEHDDHHDAVISSNDSVSFYDGDVQDIELHITAANLQIGYDSAVSDQVHLEITGPDADKFNIRYETDDGLRKMVVRDGRNVSAGTPADSTTVSLTLPLNFRDIEASVVTGSIVICGLSIDDVELETGTGNIEASELTVGKLDLKTGTGNITVGPVTPGAGEHEIELKTGTGTIDAVINAAKSDYEYTLSARQGDVYLNNEYMSSGTASRGGLYELEAEAGTGDIGVTFSR